MLSFSSFVLIKHNKISFSLSLLNCVHIQKKKVVTFDLWEHYYLGLFLCVQRQCVQTPSAIFCNEMCLKWWTCADIRRVQLAADWTAGESHARTSCPGRTSAVLQEDGPNRFWWMGAALRLLTHILLLLLLLLSPSLTAATPLLSSLFSPPAEFSSTDEPNWPQCTRI